MPAPLSAVKHTDAEIADWAQAWIVEEPIERVCLLIYGSPIWNANFEAQWSMMGLAPGWHRSFCTQIKKWRGTREVPALMTALDRGGSCRGVRDEFPSSTQTVAMLEPHGILDLNLWQPQKLVADEILSLRWPGLLRSVQAQTEGGFSDTRGFALTYGYPGADIPAFDHPRPIEHRRRLRRGP